jgi:hypothetical protein
MFGALFIDGERAEGVDLIEEDGARIQYEQETENEYRCKNCGEDLADYGDHYETDSPTCADNMIEDPNDPENEIEGPHVPETIPLTFFNSGAIDMDADEDSITVSISVGDPRGAFTMTIRRLPAHTFEPRTVEESEDRCQVCYEPKSDQRHKGRGLLIMHLPYEGMGWAHEPLKKLSEGTYRVGDYGDL